MSSTILRAVFRPPIDVVVGVLIMVVAVSTSVLPGVRVPALQAVFGVLFVLFVPGYLFISAVFPRAKSRSTTGGDSSATPTTRGIIDTREISQLERLMLSCGMSVGLTPVVGLLVYLVWDFRLVPILVGLGTFSVCLALVASYRRSALAEEDRYRLELREWTERVRHGLVGDKSRTVVFLNVLLVLGFVLTGAAVAGELAGPNEGKSLTEFYLLTENEHGELTMSDYPRTLESDGTVSVHVGIGNQENRPMNYTVVVLLQEVNVADDETRVLEETELTRYGTTVPDGETDVREVSLDPSTTDGPLRLAFLLYRGTPAEQPSMESAYHYMYLLINTDGSESDGTEASSSTN